jgi:hypothetical protein
MSNKKFMIVLTGQGDTHVTLANPEAEEWIDSPYPPMEDGAAYEEIPAAVLAGYEDEVDETQVMVTRGSGDNDRAMAAPGDTFHSITDAMKYIRKNKIEITGEYHGCIY